MSTDRIPKGEYESLMNELNASVDEKTITEEDYETIKKRIEDKYDGPYTHAKRSKTRSSAMNSINDGMKYDVESSEDDTKRKRPEKTSQKRKKDVSFTDTSSNKSPKKNNNDKPARKYDDDNEKVTLTKRELRQRDAESKKKGAKALAYSDPAVESFKALESFSNWYNRFLGTAHSNLYKQLKKLRNTLWENAKRIDSRYEKTAWKKGVDIRKKLWTLYADIAEFSRVIVLDRGGSRSEVPEQSVSAVRKVSQETRPADIVYAFDLVRKAQQALEAVGKLNLDESSGQEDEFGFTSLYGEDESDA